MKANRHPVNQELIDQASRSQRVVDAFVVFFGSLRFIAWMTVVIAGWLVVNSVWLTAGLRWDPYPFILLNLAFSAQATYAAPLILLSQNRGAERDRLKAEHDFAVNEETLGLLKTVRDRLCPDTEPHANILPCASPEQALCGPTS